MFEGKTPSRANFDHLIALLDVIELARHELEIDLKSENTDLLTELTCAETALHAYFNSNE